MVEESEKKIQQQVSMEAIDKSCSLVCGRAFMWCGTLHEPSHLRYDDTLACCMLIRQKAAASANSYGTSPPLSFISRHTGLSCGNPLVQTELHMDCVSLRLQCGQL